MPSIKNVADIKKNLLRPSLSSYYEVFIGLPNGLPKVMKNSFKYENGVHQEQLHLLCSEASLPGSQLATTEINNDFTGVTERHAYRRIFDDRLDLTFYVDVKNYLPIKLFESWIAYITGEQYGSGYQKKIPDDAYSNNYFYRMRYPDGADGYTATGLSVTKFERDYNPKTNPNILEYKFIKSWPISITSMPVSYNGSDLLRCTVSLTYIRYVLRGITAVQGGAPITKVNLDPSGLAQGVADLNTFESQAQETNSNTNTSGIDPRIPLQQIEITNQNNNAWDQQLTNDLGVGANDLSSSIGAGLG